MSIINELKWASMTAAINRIDSPNTFLTSLLYGNRQPQSTETIEIDTMVRARTMAPFVKVNAKAVPVSGPTKKRAEVSAPNIRISRTIKAHDMMFDRTPGSVIFPSRGNQNSAIREHIARELQPLADDIANTTEWMCAQTLTGTLSYDTSTDNYQGDAFEIDYQRPSDHFIQLATANQWNNVSSSADVNPLRDIKDVKRKMEVIGAPVTDAICSREAADALMDIVAGVNTPATGGQVADIRALLDTRNLTVGTVTLVEQYTNQGVQYLGQLGGVRFWEYGRTVLDYEGNTQNLIRPGYVEFVSRSAQADFVMYFGAIPDMEALQGRRWVGERFSKSKISFDPSVMTAVAHSRPLPVPRRPEATVSMQVV